MTESDQVVIGRLSSDFAVMASYLARASADLIELSRIVAERRVDTAGSYAPPVAVPAAPYWAAGSPEPVPQQAPPRPVAPPPERHSAAERSEGWIGKALAVAGVAVTLIGIALLLVLAAQAGILAPGVRVGAGAGLAAGLVATGCRLNRRPGGRVGAIALAATGIAAAYIDVVAVTTIYAWVPPPVGLVIAALVAGGGLTLARRWNSEHLGLLVLVPLIALAPAVAGDVTLLVVAFLLALSTAALPVQLGRDWTAMHAARVAVATLALMIALVAAEPSSAGWLSGACAIAAVLAMVGALLLLPHGNRPVGTAVLGAVGSLPMLALPLVADRVTSAVLDASLAAVVLGIVLLGRELPGVTRSVRRVWTALATVAGLVAVTAAFDGPIAAPVLVAMACVLAVAGRHSGLAGGAAVAFASVGGLFYLDSASIDALVTPTEVTGAIAVSTLITSVLVIACASAIVWSLAHRPDPGTDVTRIVWGGCGVAALYASTVLFVTVGVLVGGEGAGFYAGHVAATIVWIGVAAGLLWIAARMPRTERSAALVGGLALVAAAMAKLFVFDLGTLDGIFRVVVFIVVGLVLLGMGAGYARMLTQQDQRV
jgi:uncharacterized membrane protein